MDAGDTVDDFVLPDQSGTPRRLSELLTSGPVVLFFYPAAMSRGCTAEACHFRDLAAEFSVAGAQPVGISADAVERQQAFDTGNDLGFPLLSDPERTVAARFGVNRRIGGLPVKRHTFVIDTDSRVLGVVRSELAMEKHADRALDILRAAA
ncbi:peroxiredoxin [Jiangella ureilytica]|uniref:thioredoxin-dependent peroxiredoxin n=1 Tax=Jiangella ureilytica TaxID=2530374 RepID=A0A4R4S309_9ACTN|nr:peroxiredoxin [Jiangella ureilytica]TDC56686.1 peroxiredoxin [Jiangella ureilytica]